MSDEDGRTWRIEDHRGGTDGRTPCSRCGALIPRDATICSDCGVHFRGKAEDFGPRDGSSRDRPVVRVVVAMVVTLLVLLLAGAIVATLVRHAGP